MNFKYPRYKYRTRLGMTPEKAEQIRREYGTGWPLYPSQAQLAKKYGTTQANIGRICQRLYWNYKGINFK